MWFVMLSSVLGMVLVRACEVTLLRRPLMTFTSFLWLRKASFSLILQEAVAGAISSRFAPFAAILALVGISSDDGF